MTKNCEFTGSPNLECMTDDDLWAFIQAAWTDDEARTMAGQTRTGSPRMGVMEDLRDIAKVIRRARQARIGGDIPRAVTLEAAVDIRVARLPPGVSW